MNQQERIAQMFAKIDDDGRRYVLAVLQHEYDRVQASRRPNLRLLDGGQSPASIGTGGGAAFASDRRSSGNLFCVEMQVNGRGGA